MATRALTTRARAALTALAVAVAVSAAGCTTAAAAAAPSLALSVASGPAGTEVSASGTGFASRVAGTVTFAAAQVASFKTTRRGAFSAVFSVPAAPAGAATVTAAVRSSSARQTFTVTSAAPGSVQFGVSTPAGARDLSELDAFETSAAKRVSIVTYFQGWAYDEFDPALAGAVAARGATPAITWEPWDYRAGLDQPAFALARIADGAHDAYITRWAEGAKRYGKPVIVRFAHEMNDRHYPWSEQVNGNRPGQFVAAWRHVVDVFRTVGATNVSWVWAANPSYSGTTPLAGLYPGDAYVDWVGVDGYNGGTALSWGGWLSFSQIFDATLSEIRAITTTKPVMVAEVASTEVGGSKAEWIRDFFSQLAQRPQIRAFVWFNHDKETDWRIESSSTSRQAFAAGVSDPRYR